MVRLEPGAAPAPELRATPGWLGAGVTHAAPWVRDGLDLHRSMLCWAAALVPCLLVGAVNVGRQAFRVAGDELPGWRADLLRGVGLGTDPGSLLDCLAYGLSWALPALAVSFGVGWLAERGVARLREREPSPDAPVVALLLVLMLPPSVPLWQVALGIAFALVVGLGIFGGTGRNVVHPVLVGLALLSFGYPASFAGSGVWVAAPGADVSTLLGSLGQGSTSLDEGTLVWLDTLMGWEPGGLGETSALACLLGGVFLVATGLASPRVIVGAVIGLVVTAAFANAFADPTRPLVGLPWYWHLTTGSFAFGVVFVATDPVTGAGTPAGRWAYGALIGALVVLVRVFNPALSEGVLVALLLANVLAPLLDHAVVGLHGARRRRRLA